MNTLLTVALTSQILPDLPTLSAKEFRELARLADDADTVLMAAETLGSEVQAAVSARLERLEEFESALEKFGHLGICAVTQEDASYAARWREVLRDRSPILVFCSGSLGILNEASIGIVGSRNVDDVGRTFAEDVAREIAWNGMAVVSGGAKGVDLAAMMAANAEGGHVLGVLADSMTRAIRDPGVADMLESGRLCLCTPYSPDAPFNVGNAMGRNKLIYGHAAATVVVSSDLETGGTWSGAIEALRLGLGSVLVRDGEDVPDGNRALIKKGGVPIQSPSDIWDAMLRPASAQQSLF